MHYRGLFLLALVAACGDDTTTTGFGGSTSTGEPGSTGQSTVEPTTGGPTTNPTGATTEGSGTDTAATSTSTTSSQTSSTTVTPETSTTTGETTGPDTTTGETGSTTGNGGLCGVDGDSIAATLMHGVEPPPCGPLEFTGQLVSDPKGPAWQLDGCPCGANCLKPDPWSFSMIAPADWLPVLPVCPTIVVERAMGFGGCEFAAVSIWDSQNPDLPAFYHAGHGFQTTQAAAKELMLGMTSVQTCDCDFCCSPPELWDIDFTHLGAKATVAEGATAPLGKFTAVNFESHSSGICDAPPAVHWALRQN